MNSELLPRVQVGAFVQVILPEEVMLSGYIARDPANAEKLRFDSILRNEEGHLQEISLSLVPDDIINVHFLHDPPEFSDCEGNTIRMPNGFFQHLN